MAPNQALERPVTPASQLHEASVPVAQRRVLCEENMKTVRLILALLLFTFLFFSKSGGAETEKKKPCKEHPMLSGPCFKIRGRMSLFNGNFPIRIWPVGTHRMLAIGQGEFLLNDYENLPEVLEKQLNWHNAMFADFTVCPFTPDEPGHMRQVCVESAENISLRKYCRRT